MNRRELIALSGAFAANCAIGRFARAFGGHPFTLDVASGTLRRHGELLLRHVREVDRFATVRERDPGIAQAYEVLALIIIVGVFGQSRHSSSRLPSGFALLHVIGSCLPCGKHTTPRFVTSGLNFY